MRPPPALFKTQRERVVESYQKAGHPFLASTLPYHSTLSVQFDVVEADQTYGLAFAVARENQRMSFFNYGVGDTITLGSWTGKATEAHTNLARAKSTNGAAEYIIEGVSLSSRCLRVDYNSSTAIVSTAVTDVDVLSAFNGESPWYDPASIVVPPQAQSPSNLENGLFQKLLPLLSLEFEWDRRVTAKIGSCSVLPQGGGASYLASNGVPDPDNVYRIPEGYLWRRDGEADSEFVARCTLQDNLVVPISLRADVDSATTFSVPETFDLELTMRLHGLEVQMPSGN